jgi:fused signal recognition particle receptor
MSWIKSIKDKFVKTSNALSDGISKIFTGKIKLDGEKLQELEDFLLMSDMGHEIASDFIKNLKAKKFEHDISFDEIKNLLKEEIANILITNEKPLDINKHQKKPVVLMLCGVNGNGKTTTAGKLAMQFKNKNLKVMLGACDTFRAAAVEQLQEWGKRVGCSVITGDQNADPASVGYRAFVEAKEQDVDILILDTAGRLHNKTNLMDELQKCVRVLQKIDSAAPHEIIMVVDSTTGQNAYNQISTFKQIVAITGLIFTKLDSTAKGGVVVGATKKYNIPVYAVGVGERIEDLLEFNAKDFAKSII